MVILEPRDIQFRSQKFSVLRGTKRFITALTRAANVPYELPHDSTEQQLLF